MLKTFTDGRSRHALQPKPLDRLFGFRILNYVAENQLTLAAGVASIHKPVDVFSFNQLEQHLEAGLSLLDRAHCKMRWDDWQMRKRPFAAFHFELLRNDQFQQMTDGRRNDVFVVFE